LAPVEETKVPPSLPWVVWGNFFIGEDRDILFWRAEGEPRGNLFPFTRFFFFFFFFWAFSPGRWKSSVILKTSFFLKVFGARGGKPGGNLSLFSPPGLKKKG